MTFRHSLAAAILLGGAASGFPGAAQAGTIAFSASRQNINAAPPLGAGRCGPDLRTPEPAASPKALR